MMFRYIGHCIGKASHRLACPSSNFLSVRDDISGQCFVDRTTNQLGNRDSLSMSDRLQLSRLPFG